MTTFPNGIARYTGANVFSMPDAAGNVFYIMQKQNDTGSVCMVRPDGSAIEVFSMPYGSGRPSLEYSPAGLVAIGNKETPTTQPPARYKIAQFVPWPAAGGIELFDAPLSSPSWDARTLSSGVWVDIPAVFGAPHAPAYLIRLCGQAPEDEVTIRAGTEAAPHFFTIQTQAPNVRKDGQGWAPGPSMYISVLGSAVVWLQICGYSG